MARAPKRPAVVLSVPCNPELYTNSLVTWRHFSPLQTLLGGEAQLQTAAAAFDAARIEVAFIPQPEIFSARASVDVLAQHFGAARSRSPSQLIHGRFGSYQHVRVLKPAANVLFSASRIRHRMLNTSGNFLVDGRLPAAFSHAVQLEVEEPLSTVDGTNVLGIAAPDAFFGIPAPPLPSSIRTDLIGSLNDLSLHAVPFSEFEMDRWSISTFEAAGDRRSFVSDAFRRVLIDDLYSRPRTEADTRDQSSFVLLPYDLDDDASAVPDLLFHLISFPGLTTAGLRVVLYPFNEANNPDRLAKTIARVRDNEWRGRANLCATHLFVARCRNPSPDADALRRLFPAAIVDCNSPEFGWTARRLANLGMRLVLLRDRNDAADIPSLPVAAHEVLFDEDRTLRLDDKLGDRTVIAGGLSPYATFQAVLAAADLSFNEAPDAGLPAKPVQSGPRGPSVEAMLGALTS